MNNWNYCITKDKAGLVMQWLEEACVLCRDVKALLRGRMASYISVWHQPCLQSRPLVNNRGKSCCCCFLFVKEGIGEGTLLQNITVINMEAVLL